RPGWLSERVPPRGGASQERGPSAPPSGHRPTLPPLVPRGDPRVDREGGPVTHSLSALDTALELLRRGLWPVVLYPAGATIRTRDGPEVATGKEPIGPAWGKTRPTEADIRRLFRAYPGAGIGVLLGPAGGVVDLEVDGPEGADSLVKLCGG